MPSLLLLKPAESVGLTTAGLCWGWVGPAGRLKSGSVS